MLQRNDPRNHNIIVNINGTLAPRGQAGVSVFDSSVQNGDAVWEGLRVYDGRIFRLREHLARLRRSARALAFQSIPSDDEITRELRRTLDANAMRDGVHIRLTLSRGEKYTSGLDPRINTNGHTLIIAAEHKPPVYDKSGITLKTAVHRRPPSLSGNTWSRRALSSGTLRPSRVRNRGCVGPSVIERMEPPSWSPIYTPVGYLPALKSPPV